MMPGRRRALPPPAQAEIAARLAAALAREEAVLFAYLFGSFAENRPCEDVDVAVFLDESLVSEDERLGFTLRLAGELDRILAPEGLTADVAVLNEASLGLRLAAVRGRVLVSRDEARRLRFTEDTALQAMDTAHLRRESLRDLLRPHPGPAGGAHG